MVILRLFTDLSYVLRSVLLTFRSVVLTTVPCGFLCLATISMISTRSRGSVSMSRVSFFRPLFFFLLAFPMGKLAS